MNVTAACGHPVELVVKDEDDPNVRGKIAKAAGRGQRRRLGRTFAPDYEADLIFGSRPA